MTRGPTHLAGAFLAAAVLVAPSAATAQNAAFQNFFFDVCATPSAAALGARCAETPGGTGNVSGDSEDSLNPSQVVSSNEAALIRSKVTRREISERLEELRQEREEAQTSGSIQDMARWGFFVSGRGTSWDRDETTEERGSDGDVYGVQVGLDYRFTDQLLFGVLFAYESGDSEFDGDAPGVNFIPPSDDGDTESDSYLLALYGSYSLNDNVYVDGSIGYGLSDYDFERKAVFQESGRAVPQTNVITSADPDGGEFLASLGVGYDTSIEALSLGAYVRGDYVRTWVESYRESDDTLSGLAMSFDRQTRDSLTSVIGGRGSYAASMSWGVLIPQLRVQYVHEFNDDEQDAKARYLLDPGGAQYRFSGSDPDEDYFELAVGLSAVLPGGWQPYAEFETLLGYDDLDRYTWVVGIRGELPLARAEPSVVISWAILLVAAFNACGHQPGTVQAPSAATPDDLLIVDCLLPGQIRQLGTRVTYMTARRAIKTTALDCAIRGGEYVAQDVSNYESALRVWRPLAEQGDLEAQNYVGEIYERGVGSEPDLPAAAAWYTRAAEQDYAPAQINLGELYELGLGVPKDVDKARELYRKASGLETTDVAFVSSIPSSGRVAELEDELARTATQMAQLRRRLAEAENAASSAQVVAAQIPDLELELTGTRTEAAELERQLEAVRADALSKSDQEQARVAELQVALAQRQEETTDLRDRILALETEQAEQRRQSGATIEELSEEREASAAQLRELESELASRSTDVAALESRLEEARRGTLAEASSSHTRLSELDAALAKRQQESAELQTRIDELETDKLVQQRDSSAKIAELEAGMDAKAEQIQRLEGQLERERLRAAELLQSSADPVEVPGPSIQIIQPLPARSTEVALPPAASSGDPLTIVGRVKAPAGLIALLIDGAEHEVNPRGIFKLTLEPSVETRSVQIAAIDSQGMRADRAVLLPGTGEPRLVERPPTQPEIDFGDYYALVIGNSNYLHLPDLKTPGNDAEEVSDLLKERFGFDVRTIHDASRYQVLFALNELRATLTDADNLLIYYAGHGELDEANMRGHWLPVDAEPRSTANWISNVAITDILNAMSARHILVVSDSCYSGTLTRSALAQLQSGLSDAARLTWQRAMVKKRSRTALTSGSLAPVLDEGAGDHSVFARAFIDALIATDSVIEGQRLYQEIAARVTYEAERHHFDQVPQYAPIKFSGHESGDFFLVRGG